MLVGPANAFRSIHHSLISYALWNYHLPGHFIQSLYTGLSAVIPTEQWETTQPVHLAKGLFQGDPLSAAIFDDVINLYLDTITSQCSHAGYRSSSSLHQLPILQYADDACLTGSSKANCQAMLDTTQKWLDWFLLKAKVPKCAAISICGHPGQCSIPFLGSNLIFFLGLPLNAALSTEHIKDQTLTKLERYLHATDQSPLSHQQKLRIYKDAILP